MFLHLKGLKAYQTEPDDLIKVRTVRVALASASASALCYVRYRLVSRRTVQHGKRTRTRAILAISVRDYDTSDEGRVPSFMHNPTR